MTIDAANSRAERYQATLRGLQRRLIRHIEAGRTTDMADAPMRNPASIYADPARYAAERQKLFLEQPLVAGLSGDIPDTGDTLVFDGAGRPMIVVRDESGIARAFLNRCTHRGARLAADGCHASLTCPFHGWTFDLQGRLVGQPGKIAFEGIDTAALNLVELPCAEWHGLIFVRATPDGAAIDVEAHLGSFAPELAQLELGTFSPAKTGTMRSQGNWKYVLETFGEGYHFAQLHPASLAQSHFNNVAVFDAFDRHHRVSFAPKPYKDLIGVPESEWPVLDSVVYMIFPNTTMLVGSPMPGHLFVQLFRIYPTGLSATETRFTLYAPGTQLDAAGLAIAQAGYDMAAQIIETEDFSIAGGAQKNFVGAPADTEVIYGRNEIALQHLHRALDEAVGSKPM